MNLYTVLEQAQTTSGYGGSMCWGIVALVIIMILLGTLPYLKTTSSEDPNKDTSPKVENS